MPETAEQHWNRLEPRLQSNAKRIIARYGGQLDELMSDAAAEFIKARETYRPGRGMTFDGWIVSCAYRSMQSARRNQFRHTERQPTAPDEFWSGRSVLDADPLFELVETLSPDARHVVNILFGDDTTAIRRRRELRKRLQEKRKHTNASIRSQLRTVLKTIDGWTSDRIANAFDELGECVAC